MLRAWQGSRTDVQEQVVNRGVLSALTPVFTVVAVEPSLLHEAVVSSLMRCCVDFCLALIGHANVGQLPVYLESVKSHVPLAALEVYVQAVYDTTDDAVASKKQLVRL